VLGIDIPRRVLRDAHLMPCAPSLHNHRSCSAQGMRDTENGLQGVALRPACRRAVGSLIGDKHVEVESRGHGLRWYARAVIRDSDVYSQRVPYDFQLDFGSNLRRFAGVKSVIHQLLDHDGGELLFGLSRHRLQSSGFYVLRSPGGFEGGSL
jgi:hypothetical protein